MAWVYCLGSYFRPNDCQEKYSSVAFIDVHFNIDLCGSSLNCCFPFSSHLGASDQWLSYSLTFPWTSHISSASNKSKISFLIPFSLVIAISHDAQTPKLVSCFCSNCTGMKQRSNPSLFLPIQLFICLAITLPFSCCYSTTAKGAAAPFSVPRSSQPFKSLSMTPSHNFQVDNQMVYRSFVYCEQISRFW